MASNNESTRLHAFDNARAVMMWLGIVLHVSINHLTFPTPIPWKDPQTSVAADVLFLVIHTFRMPVFFLLSGFLAAMMLEARGADAMLRNRVRRLALPFVIFWPLLLAGMGWLAVKFMALMGGSDAVLQERAAAMGIGPMHMWFIYYLMMYAAVAAACAAFVPARWQRGWRSIWTTLTAHWWAIPLVAIALGAAGAFHPNGMVNINRNFVPDAGALAYYVVFFLFGWTVNATRTVFVERIGRYWGAYLGAGLAGFVAFVLLLEKHRLQGGLEAGIAYANGVTALLWSLGIIGLFVRFWPHQHAALRYVADSSYWVFLVHMLGTIGFGVLLFDAPLGAGAKMAINITATTTVCLLTYHLFVRKTWIGVLLNGRRPAG